MKTYQPDLDLAKAHDVRRLEGCGCGGLGMREHMVKIDGKYWHGRCAFKTFGFESVARLLPNFRLDDIGAERMKALLDYPKPGARRKAKVAEKMAPKSTRLCRTGSATLPTGAKP